MFFFWQFVICIYCCILVNDVMLCDQVILDLVQELHGNT